MYSRVGVLFAVVVIITLATLRPRGYTHQQLPNGSNKHTNTRCTCGACVRVCVCGASMCASTGGLALTGGSSKQFKAVGGTELGRAHVLASALQPKLGQTGPRDLQQATAASAGVTAGARAPNMLNVMLSEPPPAASTTQPPPAGAPWIPGTISANPLALATNATPVFSPALARAPWPMPVPMRTIASVTASASPANNGAAPTAPTGTRINDTAVTSRADSSSGVTASCKTAALPPPRSLAHHPSPSAGANGGGAQSPASRANQTTAVFDFVFKCVHCQEDLVGHTALATHQCAGSTSTVARGPGAGARPDQGAQHLLGSFPATSAAAAANIHHPTHGPRPGLPIPSSTDMLAALNSAIVTAVTATVNATATVNGVTATATATATANAPSVNADRNCGPEPIAFTANTALVTPADEPKTLESKAALSPNAFQEPAAAVAPDPAQAPCQQCKRLIPCTTVATRTCAYCVRCVLCRCQCWFQSATCSCGVRLACKHFA